jgi:hypothetical protein
MSDAPIRIVRVGDTFVRGVLHPFRSTYKIVGSGEFRDVGDRLFEVDYQGTPVGVLRRIAARLGREQGRRVVDETKGRR